MSAHARPFTAPADFPNNHVVSITQFDRGSVECVRRSLLACFSVRRIFGAHRRICHDDGVPHALATSLSPCRFLCAVADIMRGIVERKGGCDVLKHKVRGNEGTWPFRPGISPDVWRTTLWRWTSVRASRA
jgi:hypothetical protein